jgi:hypothetical protein
VADPTRWSTRRLGVVGGPAFFFALSVMVATGAPDLGARLTWLGFCIVTGYFLVRAWRVGVELTVTDLVVRDLFRTHRIRWSEMTRAGLEPMRTASPLKNQFPYVTLALGLTAGGTRRFEGVSAAEAEAGVLETMVERINQRIGAA